MNEKPERKVRIEPAVTEAWFAKVMGAGCSPTEFAEFVLREADLTEWLPRFGRPSEAAHAIENADRRVVPPVGQAHERPVTSDRGQSRRGNTEWTRRRFSSFLDYISSSRELKWSYVLLGAYLRVGPIPSSGELQSLCGFSTDDRWQQALRVAKQKLTLQARKIGAPSLFPRAKTGTEGQRLHPIEPSLYMWLKEWATDEESSGVDLSRFPAPESWGLSEDAESETDE